MVEFEISKYLFNDDVETKKEHSSNEECKQGTINVKSLHKVALQDSG